MIFVLAGLILLQTTITLAMLNECEEDEVVKLWHAKAKLQATVNSLNEQLAKAEAKKKEEVDLIQHQLESIETSHCTLMARKDVKLEKKN